jgi:hypothetical protein
LALDRKIEQAIVAAVGEARQSPDLARKLIAWFGAVASGNEEVHDAQSAQSHLDVIYEEVMVTESSQESD